MDGQVANVTLTVMLTRPAGHEAKAERVRPRTRPKIFFEAEATMYEAEARHVREQLSVYEHEDVLRSEHSFQ